MSVLLLRLAAPLQSWGGASRYMTRGTLPAPTKSGVVGLLAAALGRRRGADLTDITALRYGVRLDQPGRVLIDYHTVSGASHAPGDPARQRLPTADGGSLKPAASTKVTRRHYLADAVFVAAMEGDDALLDAAAKALRRPRYPLYLGRRSCPPDRPVLIGLRDDTTLDEAMPRVPWQAGVAGRREHGGASVVELDALIEIPAGAGSVERFDGIDTWPDQLLPSPAFARRFAERPIRHTTMHVSTDGSRLPEDPYDPMSLLEAR